MKIEIVTTPNKILKKHKLTLSIEVIVVPDKKLEDTAFGPCETCETIYNVITSKYSNAKMVLCHNEGDLRSVVDRKPDLVVLTNKIMFINSRKIWLSDYFENEEVNFTGSLRHALSYDSNKISAKEKVASHNIDIADFFTAIPNEYLSEQSLPLSFPLFIKPIDAANSKGVDTDSLVHNFEGFQQKVQHLYDEYAEPALVEEYLDGREFTVAVIEDGEQLIIAPIEIIPPEEGGVRILGAKVKTDNTETLHSITDKVVLSSVMDIAKHSFRALGARDYGRIDIKMDQSGTCHFMEANLVPGMKKGSSYFPQAYEISADLDYDEVVHLMLQGATHRNNISPIIQDQKEYQHLPMMIASNL